MIYDISHLSENSIRFMIGKNHKFTYDSKRGKYVDGSGRVLYSDNGNLFVYTPFGRTYFKKNGYFFNVDRNGNHYSINKSSTLASNATSTKTPVNQIKTTATPLTNTPRVHTSLATTIRLTMPVKPKLISKTVNGITLGSKGTAKFNNWNGEETLTMNLYRNGKLQKLHISKNSDGTYNSYWDGETPDFVKQLSTPEYNKPNANLSDLAKLDIETSYVPSEDIKNLDYDKIIQGAMNLFKNKYNK